MDWKKFFTPTIRNVLYFPTFFLVLAFFLWSFRIIPCSTAPLTTGEPAWQPGWCSLNIEHLTGILINWNLLSYVEVMSMLVFAPYLMSCLVDYKVPKRRVFKRKKKKRTTS